MCKLRRIFPVFVCFVVTNIWAAGPTTTATGSPTVYVSTGTAGKIYAISTANGKATALLSTSGADYEGMVVGPDNAPGTTHPFLLYVCDPTNNQIIRFDPTAKKIVPETVYQGSSPASPQCGRFTAAGDLVVTSSGANSGGLWVLSGISAQELGTAGTATTLTGGTFTNLSFTAGGLAQKNGGDILLADTSGNQILRSAPPSTSGLQTSSLYLPVTNPLGIARLSGGGVYISSSTSASTGTIALYNAPNPQAACTSNISNGVPSMMQASLDDTVYAAVASTSSGSVQVLDSNCNPLKSFSLNSPAKGIALPPTSVTQPVSISSGSALLGFGFSAFQLNQIFGNACSGTVSVSLASPESLAQLLSASGIAATPAVNLGLDGFETVFNTANLNKCTAKDGVTMNFQVANYLSTAISTPEVVVCDDLNTNCQPQAVNLLQIGNWPVEGYLPRDLTTGGAKSLKCNIFMANATPPVTDPGRFCLFQSPVNNTYNLGMNPNGATYPWDPNLASVLSAGKSVPLKFRLSPNGNSCGSAPYITDAIAQLSVALLPDSVHSYTPIGLVSNGSSGLAPPIFKLDGNQNYLFNWDTSSCIMPSGKVQVCPAGTYSVTVQLQTGNTSGSSDSIYTTQTTLVVLK